MKKPFALLLAFSGMLFTTFTFTTVVARVANAQEVQIDARKLIDRTQNDLKQCMEFERQKGRDVAHYENAQRSLSDFDRDFTEGRFDRHKLDHAIDDVKYVANHSTLDPGLRDSLATDLSDLRLMRTVRK